MLCHFFNSNKRSRRSDQFTRQLSPSTLAQLKDAAQIKEFELRAMQHFNRRREFWMHIVDAGELGILLLEQSGGHWQKSWIELENIPVPAPELVGEKKGGEGHE